MPTEMIGVLIGAVVIILGIVAWRFYKRNKRRDVKIVWEETVMPPHIHAWVDEMTTIRNLLESIGYEKPYEELVEHLRFADTRTDKILDGQVDEHIEALIRVAVTKDRKGIEKVLKELGEVVEQRRKVMATREGDE